jgi:hypothetical protein
MGLGSGIRDPGSGIRKKPIPDPGSRGQKGTGSRIRIRNTADSFAFKTGAQQAALPHRQGHGRQQDREHSGSPDIQKGGKTGSFTLQLGGTRGSLAVHTYRGRKWHPYYRYPIPIPSKRVMSSPFQHKTIFFSEFRVGDLMLYVATKFN